MKINFRFFMWFLNQLLVVNLINLKVVSSQELYNRYEKKVSVGVYYEAFSDDSIDFISKLMTIPNSFKNISQFDLTPWGKSVFNDSGVFCNYGDINCYANRIHACAIDLYSKRVHLSTKENVIDFINCTIISKNWKSKPYDAGNKCTPILNSTYDWKSLNRCAKSDYQNDDSDPLKIMYYKTLKLKSRLQSVPWIIIDGLHSPDAISDIKLVICNAYQGEKPPECSHLPNTSTTLFIISTTQSNYVPINDSTTMLVPFESRSNISLYVLIPVVSLVVIIIVAIILLKCGRNLFKFIRTRLFYPKSSECILPRESSTSENILELTSIQSFTNAEMKYNIKYQIERRILDLLKQKNFLVDPKTLEIVEDVASGQFGYVYKGYLSSDNTKTTVAIKKLKEDFDKKDVDSLLNEGILLLDCSHDRLLLPIAMSIDENGFPIIILPFMEKKDLLQYLRNSENLLPYIRLLEFAQQIAEGMVYLSNMGVIHRDLAARNILLDENLSVKISDFGLSRKLYEKLYYRWTNDFPMPVKWMSPESLDLQMRIFTTMSDVWSYGVLFWEILTRGRTPYQNIPNSGILEHIKSGNRLCEPPSVTENISKLLNRCWASKPELRPKFSEILKIIKSEIEYSVPDLNSYMTTHLSQEVC